MASSLSQTRLFLGSFDFVVGRVGFETVNDATEFVVSGSLAFHTTVVNGGVQVVSGAEARETDIKFTGIQIVDSAGRAGFAAVSGAESSSASACAVAYLPQETCGNHVWNNANINVPTCPMLRASWSAFSASNSAASGLPSNHSAIER